MTAYELSGRGPVAGWNHGDLIVSAPGFASTISELGSVDGLKKVDVTLKRGTKVRLRVRDADGKPIAPALMPLPQVYLAHGTGRMRGSRSRTRIRTRGAQAVARTNFLNVRPEAGGDFTFQVRTDQPEPLYFGFSHPDVLLYYEKGPVHGVGTCRRSLGRRFAPARDCSTSR